MLLMKHTGLYGCLVSQSWVLVFQHNSHLFFFCPNPAHCLWKWTYVPCKMMRMIKFCTKLIWGLMQQQETEGIIRKIFQNLPCYCFYRCMCSFMKQFGVFSFFICIWTIKIICCRYSYRYRQFTCFSLDMWTSKSQRPSVFSRCLFR